MGAKMILVEIACIFINNTVQYKHPDCQSVLVPGTCNKSMSISRMTIKYEAWISLEAINNRPKMP
jgi:hypothetical protein